MQPIQNRTRILENGKQVYLDFYVYQVPVISGLAAGAAQTQQIIIQADSDFEWLQSAYEYDESGAAMQYSTRPLPLLSVLIVDGGSGRQLSNLPVPVMSIFGRPESPYTMPISRTFKANATIQFNVSNFGADTAGSLRLNLIGLKQFYMN